MLLDRVRSAAAGGARGGGSRGRLASTALPPALQPGAGGSRGKHSSSMVHASSVTPQTGEGGAADPAQVSGRGGGKRRTLLDPGQRELLSVRGLGRKYMQRLWDTHDIRSLNDLRERFKEYTDLDSAAAHLQVRPRISGCMRCHAAAPACWPSQHLPAGCRAWAFATRRTPRTS
jgi:hypothetical protein